MKFPGATRKLFSFCDAMFSYKIPVSCLCSCPDMYKVSMIFKVIFFLGNISILWFVSLLLKTVARNFPPNLLNQTFRFYILNFLKDKRTLAIGFSVRFYSKTVKLFFFSPFLQIASYMVRGKVKEKICHYKSFSRFLDLCGRLFLS